MAERDTLAHDVIRFDHQGLPLWVDDWNLDQPINNPLLTANTQSIDLSQSPVVLFTGDDPVQKTVLLPLPSFQERN